MVRCIVFSILVLRYYLKLLKSPIHHVVFLRIVFIFLLSISVPGFRRRVDDLRERNREMVHGFLMGYPLNAFRKRFTKSSGKQTLKAFLEMACLVMQENMNGYYLSAVGSSNDPIEKLPVQLVCSEVFHRSSPTLSMNLRRNASHGSLDAWSPDASNDGELIESPGSSVSCVPLQSGIYPDLILLAGHKPNWPRYLFVCEVKVEFPDKKAVSQLIREMLPAMLSQSLVFGILMTSTHAWVCAMRQDFEKRKLYVTKHMFHFISWDVTGSTGFNLVNFEAFFMKILRYLNYGLKHIKGIRHGLDGARN